MGGDGRGQWGSEHLVESGGCTAHVAQGSLLPKAWSATSAYADASQAQQDGEERGRPSRRTCGQRSRCCGGRWARRCRAACGTCDPGTTGAEGARQVSCRGPVGSHQPRVWHTSLRRSTLSHGTEAGHHGGLERPAHPPGGVQPILEDVVGVGAAVAADAVARLRQEGGSRAYAGLAGRLAAPCSPLALERRLRRPDGPPHPRPTFFMSGQAMPV